MPLLLWFFSAAFIGGIGRALLIGIGVGTVTFGASQSLVFVLSQKLYNGTHGWPYLIDYMLTASGLYDAFSVLLSALTTRIAITALRRFRIL